MNDHLASSKDCIYIGALHSQAPGQIFTTFQGVSDRYATLTGAGNDLDFPILVIGLLVTFGQKTAFKLIKFCIFYKFFHVILIGNYM